MKSKVKVRIIFAAFLTLSSLSGCSFFQDTVQTCDELQEYQENISISPLIVPDSLRNVQKKSVFNISNKQESYTFQESLPSPRVSEKSVEIPNQINQIKNIEGDELSELLQLIDQTILYRQLEQQNDSIFVNLTIENELDPLFKPCLDEPPQYFTKAIVPRSMPAQTVTRSSDISDITEEEKSRRQQRKESRKKQKIKTQPQEDAEETASEEDAEEDKSTERWRAIAGAVLGLFSGGSSQLTTFGGGSNVVPPPPVDEEIEEDTVKVLADEIRNLAVLDPKLSDDERIFIQNMSDKEILEIVEVIMRQTQNKDSGKQIIPDAEKINETISKTEKDDWFTRVKDQWTERKAQRETRREARQQGRAEKQDQDD